MSEKAKQVDKLTFEEALAELEMIVGQLEKGNVPLEQSIAIYERGALLRERCDALLKAAEARIEKITQGKDGAAAEPLDVE